MPSKSYFWWLQIPTSHNNTNNMVYVRLYNHLEFLHCFMSPLSVNNDNSFSQLDEIFGAKLWPPTSILHDPLEDWFSSFSLSPLPHIILLASFSIYGGKCAPFSVHLGVNPRVGSLPISSHRAKIRKKVQFREATSKDKINVFQFFFQMECRLKKNWF